MGDKLKLIRYDFHGNTFYFHETPTIETLIREIFSDNYRIFQYGIKFGSRDIIFDIGANEGVFSIMLAKIFPESTIISLEPVSRTYRQLLDNVSINSVRNIQTMRRGIGGTNRKEIIHVDNKYSGGSSVVMTPNSESFPEEIELITLEKLFHAYSIPAVRRCSLLKIDIEGMEHESIDTKDSLRLLPYIDNVVAEVHINKRLEAMGYSIEKFVNKVSKKTSLLHYESCKMSE